MPVDNSVLRADYSISGFIKPDRGGAALALRMVDVARAGEIVWSGEFSICDRRVAQIVQPAVASRRDQPRLGDRKRQARRASQERRQRCLSPLSRGPAIACQLRSARGCAGRANPSGGPSMTIRVSHHRGRASRRPSIWNGSSSAAAIPDLLNVAREQSDIALALDPNDAIGHWMKGTVALYQRDFDECEVEAGGSRGRCARTRPICRCSAATRLSHLGDPEAGWRKFERAIDLNPLPPDHYWWAGASIAFRQQAFQKAIDLCGKLCRRRAGLVGAGGQPCAARRSRYGPRLRKQAQGSVPGRLGA